jgi:hypothetical protein
MQRLMLVLAVTICLTGVAYGLPSYTGFLSTPDGVDGSGIWADNFKIEWQVDLQQDDSWWYRYWLTETDGSPLDPGALSHWIVEVSPDVDISDFWGFNGNPVEIGDWVTESGFPFDNGMKLDYGTDGQTEWSFYSLRSPVWGDFFAKDGRAEGDAYNKDGTADGGEWNWAWNTGFFDPDPLDAPANGSIGYKILRPDTDTVIPEPTTLGLLGMGLMGLAIGRRKQKK